MSMKHLNFLKLFKIIFLGVILNVSIMHKFEIEHNGCFKCGRFLILKCNNTEIFIESAVISNYETHKQ